MSIMILSHLTLNGDIVMNKAGLNCLFFLEDRATKGERETFHPLVYSPVSETTRTKLAQSQETKTQPQRPTRVAGAQVFKQSSPANSQNVHLALAEGCNEEQRVRTQTQAILIWVERVPDGILLLH